MPLYTFRVTFEEDENIFRDVQIKPAQSVNTLNRAIVLAYRIKNEYTPSLFISNDGWKKVSQLSGVSMDGIVLPEVKDDSIPPKKKDATPAEPTKKAPDTSQKLFDIINDPHQKLIAEYEGATTSTFLIELLSINVTEDKSSVYPLCSKSVGPSPFQNDDLKKYLDGRATGAELEEYALDKEDDDTDEMGVLSDGDEETSEDAAVDPEIADEFGSTEGGVEDVGGDE